MIEPFSGMAAISIAAAHGNRTDCFYINDLNAPLVNMLQEAVEHPQRLVEAYTEVWNEQFSYSDDHVQHFYVVRERFNNGEESPANILYLLVRCVKGAVRYGKNGNFNQSPDKRRHGTNPKTLAPNVYAISRLLKGKATFSALDYHDVLDMAKPGDLVYMDPPYQGVSNVRDNRYYAGVPFDEFAAAIEVLDRRGVYYLISYDGECGGKEYGEELPKNLHCQKVMLNAGLSSQALLLGKKATTLEALYISKTLLLKPGVKHGQAPTAQSLASLHLATKVPTQMGRRSDRSDLVRLGPTWSDLVRLGPTGSDLVRLGPTGSDWV